MNAYKMYTTLDLTKKMPKFPFSFLDGAMLSLFPKIWYHIMNPLVDEVIEGKAVPKEHYKQIK